MTDAIFLLMIFGTLLFVLLLLRFVQPQLIYSLRQVLSKIEVNRAVLQAETDSDLALARYQNALIKDIRYESQFYSDSYVMERLKKISELYRILDRNMRDGDEVIEKERSPQICIIELANLLDSLGRNLIPTKEFDSPFAPAHEILEFLKARTIDKLKNEGQVPKIADSLETWYVENPMTIEQCIELLSATAWALACRQISHSPSSG